MDDYSITVDELVRVEGRLDSYRLECPRPDCGWWVPESPTDSLEGRAEAHVCTQPVYDGVERDLLVDTGDVEIPEDYVAKFVDEDTGELDFTALAADALPRPRSERIALLFGFEAFDYQRAILDDPNPDVAVNMGRQVGKTETAGAIGADAILFSAYVTDDDVGYYGDVADTAAEAFRRCKQHLKECPVPLEKLGVDKDNETEWSFDNGTRLITGSLNEGGDNERGKLPKVAIVDEAALIERSAFDRVVEPMFMTHGDDHELFVLSTPRGQTGYHYDAVMPDRSPDYFSAHTVPSWGNPIVDTSWLEKKSENTDRISWRQEYLGRFVSEGNAYIPTDIYRPCQIDVELTRGEGYLKVDGHPNEDCEYYGGLDVAGGGADRTVYVVMTGAGRVVHIESEDKSNTPDIVGRVGELHDTFDFVSFLIDKNAIGEGVVDYTAIDEDLAGAIEGIAFSTKGKSQMYKTLKKAFEGQDIGLPKHGRMERETTKLDYDFTGNRHVKVGHPDGGHDDHPDALAAANYARERFGSSRLNRSTPDGPSKRSRLGSDQADSFREGLQEAREGADGRSPSTGVTSRSRLS